MRFDFYIATDSKNGLEKGKHYFVGKDRMLNLRNGKRGPFFVLRSFLKPIPLYEGQLKEEWHQDKKEIRMGISDLFDYEETQVKLIEVYQKKKGMVCLAQLPMYEEYVQIDVPHLWVS